MLPFDTTLYRKGWYDNHRAGGPETWVENYYKGPKDNIMYTSNRTEVYLRGEEGAISTPPRIQMIYDQIKSTGKTGSGRANIRLSLIIFKRKDLLLILVASML